jgi:hypothetical protein
MGGRQSEMALVIVDDKDAGRQELTPELESRWVAHYWIVSITSRKRRWPG